MSVPHNLSTLNLLPIQILVALSVIPYLQNTIVHMLVRWNLLENNSSTSLATPGPYRQALTSRLNCMIRVVIFLDLLSDPRTSHVSFFFGVLCISLIKILACLYRMHQTRPITIINLHI